MSATHVYAIVPTQPSLDFDVLGVGGESVRAVQWSGATAVVSSSPVIDYRGLRREDLVRYLLAHQCVVEAVMRRSPVLPVKFGTVLSSEDEVMRLLRQGRSAFGQAMGKLDGRTQVEIVVFWDLPEVFKEIAEQDQVAALKGRIAARPAEATVTDRVALGRMVKECLEERRAAVKDAVLPHFREVAADVVANPTMDDSMVTNLALLVDENGRKALDERLSALDKGFDGKLSFRCVGPLPPYSFACVEARPACFEEIDEARKLLGLGDESSPEEIKRAYRAMAGEIHPDLNPESDKANDEMADLAGAYETLWQYAESAALDGGGSCSFDRAAVEATFLIRVGKQESTI
jgi:hypothetical protein